MFLDKYSNFDNIYSNNHYNRDKLCSFFDSLDSINIPLYFELKYRISNLILESKSDAFSNDTHNKINTIEKEAKKHNLSISIDYSFDAKLILTIKDNINKKIA
jgi:hypothetical protein